MTAGKQGTRDLRRVRRVETEGSREGWTLDHWIIPVAEPVAPFVEADAGSHSFLFPLVHVELSVLRGEVIHTPAHLLRVRSHVFLIFIDVKMLTDGLYLYIHNGVG